MFIYVGKKKRTGIKKNKNALYHFGYDVDYLIFILKIYLWIS